MRGTDFDLLPGKGVTFSGFRKEGNVYNYQTETGMKLVPVSDTPMNRRFFFDCGWDQLSLEMETDEFAVYSFYRIEEGCSLRLELSLARDASLIVCQDGTVLKEIKPENKEGLQEIIVDGLKPSEKSGIKVLVKSGVVRLDAISLLKA